MFEINNNKVEKYKHFSVIRDFYKEPDQVVKFIHSHNPEYHKHPFGFFSQGYDFEDMRHTIFHREMRPVWDFLINLTGQKPASKFMPNVEYVIETNYTYFYKIYKNKYFYPHQDFGKTALVYLDKEAANGTNIYEPITYTTDNREEHKEHYADESELKVIAHIPSEYNKLVIWDGMKYHGLCQDEKYLNAWRLNQVFLFQK